jgi:hypothetical protein
MSCVCVSSNPFLAYCCILYVCSSLEARLLSILDCSLCGRILISCVCVSSNDPPNYHHIQVEIHGVMLVLWQKVADTMSILQILTIKTKNDNVVK